MRHILNNDRNCLIYGYNDFINTVNATFSASIERDAFISNLAQITQDFTSRLNALEKNLHLDHTNAYLVFYEDTLAIYSRLKSAIENKQNNHKMSNEIWHKLDLFDSFKRRYEAVEFFRGDRKEINKWKELIRSKSVVTGSAEYREACQQGRGEELLEKIAIESYKSYQYQFEVHRARNNNLVYAMKAIAIGGVLAGANSAISATGFFKNYWAWLTSRDMLAVSSFSFGIPFLVGFAIFAACVALVPVTTILAGVSCWALCDLGKYAYDTSRSQQIALEDHKLTNAIAAVDLQPRAERKKLSDKKLFAAIAKENTSAASFVRQIRNRVALHETIQTRMEAFRASVVQGPRLTRDARSRICDIASAVKSISTIENPGFYDAHPILRYTGKDDIEIPALTSQLQYYGEIKRLGKKLKEYENSSYLRDCWESLVLRDGSALRSNETFLDANKEQRNAIVSRVAYEAYISYCEARKHHSDKPSHLPSDIIFFSIILSTTAGLEYCAYNFLQWQTDIAMAFSIPGFLIIGAVIGFMALEQYETLQNNYYENQALAPENLNNIVDRITRRPQTTEQSSMPIALG